MANKIICKSCGGEFDDNLAKCPYCGSMNISGAEAEYMDKLDDVREDMDDLKEAPVEETKKEIKKQGRFLKKIFLVIGLVIVGLLVLWLISTKLDSRYERDRKADFLWQEQYFPKMDQLYQEGKYDELITFFESEEAYDQPIWNWEHYEFIDAYWVMTSLKETLAREEQGIELSDHEYVSILCDELHIIGALQYADMSDEERELLAGYAKPYLEDYEERWGMTPEDKEFFANMLEENKGYYLYSDCEKYAKKWYKENIKSK